MGGRVTLDLCTDDYRKVAYLRVAIHYVEPQQFRVVERVLCVTARNRKLQRTLGRPLCKHSEDLISTALPDSWFSLRTGEWTWLQPSSTILEHTTKPGNQKGEAVTEFIHASRHLVSHFNRSGLQSRLQKSLKGDVEMRWNRKLLMFKTISKQWDRIYAILIEKRILSS